MKTRCKLLFLPLVFPLTSARAIDHFEVTIERNVQIKMRDGVVLRADTFRPKVEGKFPVLLERTPYNKQGGDFGWRDRSVAAMS